MNAELQVGALDEVLTVTAESPIVDVINNQATFVANREVLDAIPTTRRDTTARALLIPGTTVTPFVLGQYNLTSHGSATSDFTMAIDGLRVNNLCGSGQYSGFYMNDAAVQELNYSTGSESAEIQSSGIRVNQVPKDGGNKFFRLFFVYGQGSSLQSDNRTDAMKALQANGLPLITIAGTAYDWQINPSFGGPIAKDKLWFYVDLQVPEGQELRPELAFRRRQPGVPRGHGQLQRHRPRHLGGVEQGQDPRLRREAVHRRVLQRVRHPADLDTRGDERRLGHRMDPTGAVDARAVEQAAVRSRHRRVRPDLLAGLQRGACRH